MGIYFMKINRVYVKKQKKKRCRAGVELESSKFLCDYVYMGMCFIHYNRICVEKQESCSATL